MEILFLSASVFGGVIGGCGVVRRVNGGGDDCCG